MARLRYLLGLLAAILCVAPAAPQTHPLSFLERVEAQRAIERVYYSHQIGAALPFEEAVPPALLERKVRTYLKQSVALETIWRTPVTATLLDREVDRMRLTTRLPGRLRELFAALNNDGLLIRECLARPLLVSRLLESFYSMDQPLHAQERSRAEEIGRELERHTGDAARMPEPRLVEVEIAGTEPATDSPGALAARPDSGAPTPLWVSRDEFRERRGRLPAAAGSPGEIQEDKDSFTISVLLEERSDRFTVANYVVAKRPLQEWWSEIESDLDERTVGAVGNPGGSAMSPALQTPCNPDNTWDTVNLNDEVPSLRSGHTAVWTGTLMIMWGGLSAGTQVNTGASYDPATDTWSRLSTLGAPSPRQLHAAVWTGSRMVVWSGNDASGYPNTGGRYDPAADQWQPTSTSGAPAGRLSPTAVWTGTRMIVWGGGSTSIPVNTGGSYDPAADTWAATAPSGAPSPRTGHSAVWTGSRMVIWGGWSGSNYLSDGALYDPGPDTWAPMSAANAPSPRYLHTAVWTGTSMVVWGGGGVSSYLNTGGRYNPALNSWAATSTSSAPEARVSHTAVWTGSRMIVWGGSGQSSYLNTGGRYDPSNDSWVSTSTVNSPTPRSGHSAIWTGGLMVIWGAGSDGIATGGRYDPITDTWTPTNPGTAPSPRSGHSAIWTGSQMLIWGGGLNNGGRYDPATNAWASTTVAGAPSARKGNSAVWTGNREGWRDRACSVTEPCTTRLPIRGIQSPPRTALHHAPGTPPSGPEARW